MPINWETSLSTSGESGVFANKDLNLLSNIQRGVESRTKSGVWRTIDAPLGQLRCSPIRKQSFRNSGFRDVVAPDSNPRQFRTRCARSLRGASRGLRWAKGSEPSERQELALVGWS